MTTASNEARIMAAERALQTAPEPGGMQGMNTGDEDVPITNTRVTSAGYVTMWNTDTKEPSIFNMNGVRAKLKEVFPNDYVNNPAMRGLACWTPDQPNESPWRGNVTCPLHADRPERAAFDAVAGEWQVLRLELAPNGTVRWFLDGVLVRTVTGAVSTSVDLSLILALEAKGAAIEIMHVDYLMVEANRDWTA